MRGIHQDSEAREVLEAKVPLIIVQFQRDYFCNPTQYPQWYAKILEAIEARRAESGFFFMHLSGDHDDAEKLATHPEFHKLWPDLKAFWPGFWKAVLDG